MQNQVMEAQMYERPHSMSKYASLLLSRIDRAASNTDRIAWPGARSPHNLG